jgi:hypothetical protein
MQNSNPSKRIHVNKSETDEFALRWSPDLKDWYTAMLLKVHTTSGPPPNPHAKAGGGISRFLSPSVNRARIVKILQRSCFMPATVEAHLSKCWLAINLHPEPLKNPKI